MLAVALVVCVLALVVLWGWHAGSTRAVRLLPRCAAMQPSTALAFLLAGVGAASAVLHRRGVTLACGGVVAALGALTLVEYGLAMDLGTDRLLQIGDPRLVSTPYPGRMGPNTALGFLLLGVALVVQSRASRSGVTLLLAAFLGFATAALGLATLFGYLTGMETAYGWGHLNRMALHTGGAMGMLGLAVAAFCLHAALTEAGMAEGWLAVGAAVALAMISALPAYAWLKHDRLQLALTVDDRVTRVQTETVEAIEARVHALARMAARWTRRRGTPVDEWAADAAASVEQLPGLSAIAWTDASRRIRAVVPRPDTAAPPRPDLGRDPVVGKAMERALGTREVTVAVPSTTASGTPEIAVLVPLADGTFSDGLLIGIVDVRALLDTVLAHARVPDYSVAFFAGAQPIYASGPESSLDARWQRDASMTFRGVTWRLRLTPTTEALAVATPILPYLAGGGGVLLALLLGLAIHFAQAGRRRAHMAEEAKTALNTLNRTLEERVVQRTALAEQRATDLARANADLERINQELDDFAAIASHDLKEPLRGIASYATFLLEDHGPLLNDDARGKVETMVRLTRRLGSIIDALLHFSRLGRVDPAIEDVDLDEVVRETGELLGRRLEDEQVELRVLGPLPRVPCDRVWVGELLANLVSNAIKYNDKPRKWIEIGATSNGAGSNGGPGTGGAVLFVRDNGIGIAARHREGVFRIFKRLHGRDEFGGGTGAGLTIAKRIVERHGGRIWVESTDGEGTTVFFTLGGGAMPGAQALRGVDPSAAERPC
jgi:signal transduction histidine kinase